MIVIPQKLFNDPQVSTILRDDNVCILQKELPNPLNNREGYVASHAISFVQSGEQIIKFYNGEEVKIKANQLVIIPRGVYYISDLISSFWHSQFLHSQDVQEPPLLQWQPCSQFLQFPKSISSLKCHP